MDSLEAARTLALFPSIALLALGCGGAQKGLEEDSAPDAGQSESPQEERPDAGTTEAGSKSPADADAGPDAAVEQPADDDAIDIDDSFFPGNEWQRGPRKPPAEVTADDEYIEQEFVDPDARDAAVLAVEAKVLLRAIPPGERGMARDEIDNATDEETGTIRLRGAFLDPDESLFVTRYHYGAVEAVYLLLDAEGKLLHKLVVELRSGVYLKDVVGDDKLELIVSVVHGTALSTWPVSWRIYEVSGGRLRKIGRVAKSYSEGSKYERYYFLNRVEFPEKDRMVVRTVLYRSGRADLAGPPKGAPTWEGARDEYTYDPAKRKLVRTGSAPRPKPPDKKHSSPEIDGF
jgi:hypothetical protein